MSILSILSNYNRDDRPWGNFERFTLNESTTVKIITVNPDEAFSLQHHEHRTEFWKIISGSGIAIVDTKTQKVKPGDMLTIPPQTNHRMTAGPEGVQFLEISFGNFDENDIIRLEDNYGRV